MDSTIDFRSWHIPLARGQVTLRQGLDEMARFGGNPDDIPLIVRLVENPRYRLGNVEVFHGAVDLHTHDCIHLVLGRGMLAKDEAFVIGFTMGSTQRLRPGEETLYTWIARHLYPGIYRFSEEDVAVFHDGVRLGLVSDCLSLDTVDYDSLSDMPLREVRRRLAVAEDLLAAYYRIEARRYPEAPESRRLLEGGPE